MENDDYEYYSTPQFALESIIAMVLVLAQKEKIRTISDKDIPRLSTILSRDDEFLQHLEGAIDSFLIENKKELDINDYDEGPTEDISDDFNDF